MSDDNTTAKVKSNAERQKAYRERQRQTDTRMINVPVSYDTAHALACLAKYSNSTQRKVLERLIMREQNSILDGFRDRERKDIGFNSVKAIDDYISLK